MSHHQSWFPPASTAGGMTGVSLPVVDSPASTGVGMTGVAASSPGSTGGSVAVGSAGTVVGSTAATSPPTQLGASTVEPNVFVQ